MPVDLTHHGKRILRDIVATSEQIRHSASDCTNAHNFEASQRLRRQLETIRISANAILEAVTEASFTDYTLNDGLIDWLFSGTPHTCLGKLKEMDNILKPDPFRPVRIPAGHTRPVEDKLIAAMIFFDRHKNAFHFLTTSEVWDRERLLFQPSGSEVLVPQVGVSQVDSIPLQMGTEYHPQQNQSRNTVSVEYSANGLPSNPDERVTARHQKELRRQQLEEVSRWIAALDCTNKHNHLHQLCQEGTCKWFPNTDAYVKWRSRGAQFLWLHGKAGCGKSVLAASTIEHLKSTLKFQEVVVFFYFDFQNERSRNPVEMLRSLLSQLCQHLLDQDIDPYTFRNKILEEKAKGSLPLNDLDKLCDLVSCAADRFVREPIVVIDALDECGDIESLLRTLLGLWGEKKIRLLVTSRPHQSMLCHIATFPSLAFEGVTTGLVADIELHVRRETSHDRLNLAGPETRKEIQAKLIQKAEGRFRWVQCQIDILKRCATGQKLRKALDNLPTELDATYERILDAIDERRLEGKIAQRVLTWLTVALEPLRLDQILNSLSVDFSLPEKIEKEKLLDMLSSLVSHYKETDVVSLSHFSVQEYLISRTTSPMYQIVPGHAHAEAAQSCMRYISAFIKQVPSRTNVPMLESWPMLSYVLSSGFHHLAHVNPQSTATLEALQSLGSDVHHHPSHWERLCRLREEDLHLLYPPWPLSRHDFVFYILIVYAPLALFQTFLFGHRPIKTRIGTNPLVYAADLRKTDHIIPLLLCGADVNARGLAIDDSHHISPLEVAIDRNEDVVVGELLRRGCLVTSELLSTCVCLPWCSPRVLVKLVYTPKFAEWAHAIGDEKLYRGMFSSARPNAGDGSKLDEDHVALARRLREIGQDLSPDSRFGADLIQSALRTAHTSMLEYLLPADQPPPAQFLLSASAGDTSETVSVVHFLLGRGANVNVLSGNRDTVLHLAASCPWEPRSLELTEMLISAGCSLDTRNLQGDTPFTIAMSHEYHTVMEHLLSSNTLCLSHTLLYSLQQHLSPRFIEFLIRKGADVHSTTSEGETVLHLAVANYNERTCIELMKSFIEAGYDTDARNATGKTALHAAVKRNCTSVVEFLLSHYTPIPHDILSFALQQYSSFQLVQILIHRGAGLHSISSEGDTIFHLAIARYKESTCLALLESFIEAGGDPNICNSSGETVLYTAIKYRRASGTKFLLSHNVPLPHDILPFALQQRSPPWLVESLIHSGACLHSVSPEGETIFHLAIAKYSESTCLALLKRFIEIGGDPNVCNSSGETASYTAIEYGDTSVVEFLLLFDVPLPPSPLQFALQRQVLPQMVHTLIHNGANLHFTTSEGDSLLHLVIDYYDDEPTCLELLMHFIEVGCDPNISNSSGETALHTAIRRGHTSVVEFLLIYNLPLPPDLLQFALQQHSPPQLVHILICNGANWYFTTSEGDSILHLVIANYGDRPTCLVLLKNLIEAGCDRTHRNFRGKTALEMATEHGYTSVEGLLQCDPPFPPGILSILCPELTWLDRFRILVLSTGRIEVA